MYMYIYSIKPDDDYMIVDTIMKITSINTVPIFACTLVANINATYIASMLPKH